MNPGVRDWLLFAHVSAEPGHVRLLAALAAQPLLQLEMRLGEGSGAAVTESSTRKRRGALLVSAGMAGAA